MPTLFQRVGNCVRQMKARVGVFLLQRASRKQQGLFDRLCAHLLTWVTNSSTSRPDHFMRDDLIDANIEFDPKELERYQQPSAQEVVGK